MIIAAAATALGWIIMRFLVRKDFTPYFLNSVSMVLGGVMCLVHAMLFEATPLIVPGQMYTFLYYMLIMMFIQNVCAYNLQAYLLQFHSATLVAFFTFVMPLFAGLIEYLFLGQPISSLLFICTFGVAVGLLIFYYKELFERG